VTVGVLVVGLGNIGMAYDLGLDPNKYVYSHARAFDQHPGFRLVGAVDPESRQRKMFERTYSCASYADIESALEKLEPDLVVIAAPTPAHERTLQEILEQSSAKVVLCEKPLAYDVEDGRAMVHACDEKEVRLFVNYMRRSDSATAEIKRRIQAGALSTPIKGIAWYSKGLLHNGSHLFNLLEHWLGPMKHAVTVNPGRLWQGLDPEPDVHVEFSGGSVVFMAAWEEAFSHYTIELLCPAGRLRYETGGSLVQWQSASDDPALTGYKSLHAIEEVPNGMDRYQWHVADQLDRAIKGQEFALCSGAEALATLVSIQKIFGKS
jgi:predicted dehydrogenase